MSRSALHGIGLAIKANTTEKSIEQLRAEGKKRVRVVSSERVIAIIQAIVDDTINSEVGEITKRDRDRVVSDTQERFSRVLRMQQDLEQSVDDLRASLHETELERDRLRADKALLEVRLNSARRPEADAGATRRAGAEFDDLRIRLDAIGRDTVAACGAACGAATENALRRVEEQQAGLDTLLAARLDHGFRTMTDQLSRSLAEAGRSRPADDAAPSAVTDALAELRADTDQAAARAATAAARMAELQASLASRLDGSLTDLHGDLSANAASGAEAAARIAELQARLDGSMAQLRGELAAGVARSADAAERQADAVGTLRDQIARAAATQSEALQTSFGNALELALDRITRTMDRATARPIEMTGEATDVLLAKIFDSSDSKMTSNLDELDVQERRSTGSIAKNVGRLKAMKAPVKAGVPRPV